MGIVVTVSRRKREIAIASIAVFLVFADVPQHSVKAGTLGANTDLFEAGASINSPWWSGTLSVTQRYGCTVDSIAGPLEDPASECPTFPQSPSTGRWHQGMDIGTNGISITLTSAVDGTVRDFQATSCLQPSCTTLGFLAILTNGGNIVYLLHGSPICPNFCNPGNAVHVGDQVYNTGANGGLSTGYHLHFEVHKSAIGQLQQHPGDDINPEGWLWKVGGPAGQQLATWAQNQLDQFWPFNTYSAPLGSWLSYLDSETGNGSTWSTGINLFLDSHQITQPSVVSIRPGSYDAIMVDDSGALVHAEDYNGNWTVEVKPPPGGTHQLAFKTPSAATWGFPNDGSPQVSKGRLDVAAIGMDGNVYHGYWQVDYNCPSCQQPQPAWSGWDGYDNPNANSWITSTPTAMSDVRIVSWGEHQLNVVALSQDGNVWQVGVHPNTPGTTWPQWYPWTNLSQFPASGGGSMAGSFLSGLAVASWQGPCAAGDLQIFARSSYGYQPGSGSDLWHTERSGWPGCSGWEGVWHNNETTHAGGVSFTPTANFAVTSWIGYRVDLLVQDSVGNLWHNGYDLLYDPTATYPYWQGWCYGSGGTRGGANCPSGLGNPGSTLSTQFSGTTWGYPNADATGLANNGHYYQRHANYAGWQQWTLVI